MGKEDIPDINSEKVLEIGKDFEQLQRNRFLEMSALIDQGLVTVKELENALNSREINQLNFNDLALKLIKRYEDKNK